MGQVLTQTTKSTSCTFRSKLDAWAPTRPFVRLWAALCTGAAFFFAKSVRFGRFEYHPATGALTVRGTHPFVLAADGGLWVFSGADLALVSNYTETRPDGYRFGIHTNPHGVTPEGLPRIDMASPTTRPPPGANPDTLLNTPASF